jgi:hypothetical protein
MMLIMDKYLKDEITYFIIFQIYSKIIKLIFLIFNCINTNVIIIKKATNYGDLQ